MAGEAEQLVSAAIRAQLRFGVVSFHTEVVAHDIVHHLHQLIGVDLLGLDPLLHRLGPFQPVPAVSHVGLVRDREVVGVLQMHPQADARCGGQLGGNRLQAPVEIAAPHRLRLHGRRLVPFAGFQGCSSIARSGGAVIEQQEG